MKGIYIFLAEGFEEIEALATLDVLRRGGIEASTVSITDEEVVTGAHGVPVAADLTWDLFKERAVSEEQTGKMCLCSREGCQVQKTLRKTRNSWN